MSYCRMSKDSDVYLVPTIRGIECIACRLTDHGAGFGSTLVIDTHGEAIIHLFKHRQAGHLVPEYALDRLKDENEPNKERSEER